MKKIISIFVFAGALSWTWYLTNSAPTVAFETHAGIQVKLAEMILEVIKIKKPSALDPEITRLWTETLDDHKVRAVFAYKFIEKNSRGASIEQTVEGEALLYRQNGETPQQDAWALQQVKTTNQGIFFSEGATITPTTESMADEASEQSPEAGTSDSKTSTPDATLPKTSEENTDIKLVPSAQEDPEKN